MTPTRRSGGFFVTPSPLLLGSAGIHGAALASVAWSPSVWPLALGAVAASHAAITLAGLLPRAALLGPNISRLPPAAGPVVALTFDDGPDPEVTPRVATLLASAGVRATFFCIGRRAEQHPDLVRALRVAGHGIENHTYHHHNTFAFGGPANLASEIRRAQEALAQSGPPPRFFRPPAGMQSPWVPGAVAATGLQHVSWTRRGFDTVTADSHRVARRLLTNLRAGDILLLHDGNAASSATGRPVVLDALTRVLDRMVAAGLQSRPLHELLPCASRAPLSAGSPGTD